MNIYKTEQWRKVRLMALKRDHYACVMCGCDVRGKGLSRVDHIIPVKQRPDLALALANLRTLCAPCDNRRHSEKGLGKERPLTGDDGFPVGSGWS